MEVELPTDSPTSVTGLTSLQTEKSSGLQTETDTFGEGIREESIYTMDVSSDTREKWMKKVGSGNKKWRYFKEEIRG